MSRDLKAVRKSCRYFLAGHGLKNFKEQATEMAAKMSADTDADFYGEGGLTQILEEELQQLLGFESALFFPSGTMAQQIALRYWSERAGTKNIGLHPTTHLEKNEFRSYQKLHGLQGVILGRWEKPLGLADLKNNAETLAAVLLEVPHREIGGQTCSLEEISQMRDYLKSKGSYFHLDGARLWEVQPYFNKSFRDICANFDSAYVSFYKGLGAWGGAMLLGPKDLIEEAKVWRKRQGGGLFTLSPLSASALFNYRDRLNKMPVYFERAKEIAKVLKTLPGVIVSPSELQSAMMHVYVAGSPELLLQRSMEVAAQEKAWLFGYLSPSRIPGYSYFELSTGDASLEFPLDKLGPWFSKILQS